MTLSAKLCFISFSLLLFLLSGEFDPDFESYRSLYENGWGNFVYPFRDPVFWFALAHLQEYLSYEQFRYLLCLFFSIALFKLARKLGQMSLRSQFGVAQAIVLAPFIMLKLHVQIREGIALLLWLFAITNNGADISRNVRSRSFWFIAAISIGIHLSAVIWWISAIILGSRRPYYRRQALAIFLFFAVIGAATTSLGSQLLEAVFRGAFFIESEFYVQVTPAKQVFWSFFILLPLLTFFNFNKYFLSVVSDPLWRPSIFGMTGVFGLLGFFSVSMIGMYIWGVTDSDFNLTIRTAITLMMFLVIQLALSCPRRLLTWIAFVFTFLTVARLLFLPNLPV